MAHWAELNDDNMVIRVLVGSNDDPDEGYNWLVENLGGRWIKTSYNATIRKHFAGTGYMYAEEIDAFIPPKCHHDAVLDIETCEWICGDPTHEVISNDLETH